MVAPRKTRTLRLADGGVFKITAGTVSVPVGTLPLDPPAVLLHVNRSCGALELEPDDNGVSLPPVRVDAARVLQIVNQINADRATAAMRGGRAEPPVELPPTFKGTARHVTAWHQQTFPFVFSECLGYPSRTNDNTTLWVHREKSLAVLETRTVDATNTSGTYAWDEITPDVAMAWLLENGYRSVPATLHRASRERRKGAANEPPPKRRR